MAREWFSFYVRPEEKDVYPTSSLVAQHDSITLWLKNNQTASTKIKLCSSMNVKDAGAITWEEVYKRQEHQCLTHLQVKFRNKRDAVLFKMFYSDAIFIPRDKIKHNFDPVLISLIRRAMPSVIAYDICGVSPMTGPVGLIFGLRSKHLVAKAKAQAKSKKNIMEQLLENLQANPVV